MSRVVYLSSLSWKFFSLSSLRSARLCYYNQSCLCPLAHLFFRQERICTSLIWLRNLIAIRKDRKCLRSTYSIQVGDCHYQPCCQPNCHIGKEHNQLSTWQSCRQGWRNLLLFSVQLEFSSSIVLKAGAKIIRAWYFLKRNQAAQGRISTLIDRWEEGYLLEILQLQISLLLSFIQHLLFAVSWWEAYTQRVNTRRGSK